MIVKKGNKYRLISRSTGRNLGEADTEEEIKKREKQVQFFKNLKHSRGGKDSLKSKVYKKSLIG